VPTSLLLSESNTRLTGKERKREQKEKQVRGEDGQTLPLPSLSTIPCPLSPVQSSAVSSVPCGLEKKKPNRFNRKKERKKERSPSLSRLQVHSKREREREREREPSFAFPGLHCFGSFAAFAPFSAAAKEEKAVRLQCTGRDWVGLVSVVHGRKKKEELKLKSLSRTVQRTAERGKGTNGGQQPKRRQVDAGNKQKADH
jgi:hypothetical protein